MRIAVSSQGTSLDAWAGVAFDSCSQFVVVDTEAMDVLIVSVSTDEQPAGERRRALLRALVDHGASVIITGRLSELCREVMFSLGVQVIDNVGRMSVRQAVERYLEAGAQAVTEYEPPPAKVAVAAHGDDLEARLTAQDEPCTSFVLVEPQTLAWEIVRVDLGESPQQASVNAVRAAARSGATVVITPAIRPACCVALRALGIAVIIGDEGLTVREAIELYRQGRLQVSP